MIIKCDFCDETIDTDNLRSDEKHIEFSIRQPVGIISSGPGRQIKYFPAGKHIIACEKHKELQEREVKCIEAGCR